MCVFLRSSFGLPHFPTCSWGKHCQDTYKATTSVTDEGLRAGNCLNYTQANQSDSGRLSRFVFLFQLSDHSVTKTPKKPMVNCV